MNKRLGILLIIGQQLCFSVENAAIHWIGSSYSLMQLSFLRAAASLVLVLCLLPSAGGWSALHSSRMKVQLLRGAVTIGYMFVLMYSLANLPLADATAISYTQAIYIVIFGHLILGEVVGAQRAVAVVVGLAGALALIRPSFSLETAIYFAVLAGTSLNALSFVLTRYLEHDHPVTVMFYANAAVFVFFAPGVMQPWPAFDPWVLGIVVFGPLGMYFGIVAVWYADLATLAPYTYVRQVAIAFIAPLLFGEPVTGPIVIGSCLIIAACVLASVPLDHRRLKGMVSGWK